MTPPKIAQAAVRARSWLTEKALPFWSTDGMETDGLFHERTDFQGRPQLACPRRMRVQARQLYVYSEAAVRDWLPDAKQTAEAGFEALLKTYWARDGRPGFIHTIGPDRAVLDHRRDTYDHAFGLFAAAWYHRASGDPRALRLAHDVLDLMEGSLADPAHGGFLESDCAAMPRRSDPHMHLLEAMLEWTAATGEDRFRDLASRMVVLFQAKFLDRETGTLTENFAEDLSPALGEAGAIVAPGHHFEWFWLLDWAKMLGVADLDREAEVLFDYAIRHGIDAGGFAIDRCDRHGRQVGRSRRAWPQTELIKAYLVRARRGDGAAATAAADLALAFLDSYLGTVPPGLWMDQFDDQARGCAAFVPASTLYHVVVAFRELMLFAEAGR